MDQYMRKSSFVLVGRHGFTLIELLVVIAVLGVLAAAIVVAINPVQKINQANDAKVKNDVAQIATGMQAYFTLRQYYPTTVAALVTNNELNIAPTAPSGYSAYSVTTAPAGCTGTATAPVCTSVSISGQVKAPATSTNTLWCFRTSTGVASEVANAAACPAP